jgi:5'-3' exonuclease
MGVSGFYRYLAQKYPRAIVDVVDNDFDTPPTPAESDYDNLLLDFNGVVHVCTHPEGELAPPTELEMFARIDEYVDKLVAVVRPRELIYVAIDGCAPRAKMRQQRTRRYSSARDVRQQDAAREMISLEWKSRGLDTPEEVPTWDSNAITPGTFFMHRLQEHMQSYIANRLDSHALWKGLRVIFSDASVPGEAEHKLMDFIRAEQKRSNYKPTHYCLQGMDAGRGLVYIYRSSTI